jgi:hypothetical protein
VAFTATATGVPAATIVYTLADNTVITSPHIFPVGTTTVTATASSICKTVTCTFTVTVNDTENPTITCPTPAASYFANSSCTWTGTGLDAVIADNCSTPVLSYSINDGVFVSGSANGYAFPIGTTNVAYKVTDASGNSATCTFTIIVHGVTVSGVVNYYNTPNTPMNLVTVTLHQNGKPDVYSDITGVSGTYSIKDVCPGNYQVIFKTIKDVGGINAGDAAQVNAWSVAPYEIEKVRFLAGDVSGPDDDSQLRTNSNDASMILDYFVNGVIFDKPWEFWKTGETVNKISQPNTTAEINIPSPSESPSVTQNFLGLVSGDFNKSFTPTSEKYAIMSSRSLSLVKGENIQMLRETSVDLPIKVNSAMQIGAISLILNYPNDKLQIEGVFLKDRPEQSVKFSVKDGELRIGWYSLDPILLTSGETMLTVRLKTTSNLNEGEVYSFELAANPLNELANGKYVVIPDAKLIMDGLQMKNSITAAVDIPVQSVLLMNSYPNPFRENAKIEYTLPEAGQVTLEIINILGNRIMLLANQQQTAGEYSSNLDGSRLVPGVYLIILKFENQYGVLTKTIRMVKQ